MISPDNRRRRVNAGGNGFAFYRSCWVHGLYLSLARRSGHGCLMYTIRILGVWPFLRRLPIPTARRGWSARVPCGMGHSVDSVVWCCGECGSAPHSPCSLQHMAPKYCDLHQMWKEPKFEPTYHEQQVRVQATVQKIGWTHFLQNFYELQGKYVFDYENVFYTKLEFLW